MSDIIIDRRKNPKDKSLSNRKRFTNKVRNAMRKSARDAIGKRSINDTSGAGVSITGDSGVNEYEFRHNKDSGVMDYVLIGNKDYMVGDLIRKPPEKEGGGSGGSPDGQGEDPFEFQMTYDEFLDIIFEGLELPNLTKESTKGAKHQELKRAGYTPSGNPSNLNVGQTYRNKLKRKAALYWPKIHEAEDLEKRLSEDEELTEEERQAILLAIEELRAKANRVPFFEDVDFLYNNHMLVEKPITQAVMICAMDISGSMTEMHKIMAKKFFLLLNRFLRRKYSSVTVVFIRHHHTARECTEEEFFKDRDSGGTVVSSAYLLAEEILKRYPADSWNIYLAHASDGDNWPDDNEICVSIIERMINRLQFLTYMEVRPVNWSWGDTDDKTEVMTIMEEVKEKYPKKTFAEKITDDSQIVPMFRKMFQKRYT